MTGLVNNICLDLVQWGAALFCGHRKVAVSKIQWRGAGRSSGKEAAGAGAACIRKTLNFTEILLVLFQVGIQAGTGRLGGVLDFMKQ